MTEILLCVMFVLIIIGMILFRRGVLVRQSEDWNERLAQVGVRSKISKTIPNSKSVLLTPFMAKDTPSQEFTPSQFLIERLSRITESSTAARQGPLILSTSISLLTVGLTLGVFAAAKIELTDIQDIVIVLVVAIVLGLLASRLIIRYLFMFWRSKLSGQAPDVIDYLMLAVEAGINIDVALIELHRILKPNSPAMAFELEKLSNDLAILPSREVAFQKLVQRTGVDTFTFLKQALLQGEKYGTPIAASLKIVALESRQHILRARQERARKLPVFISIPLMLLILPPIIAVSTGPGFIQLMRTF